MKRPGIEYAQAVDHVSNLTKAAVDGYAAEVARDLELGPGDDLLPVVKRLGGRIRLEDLFDSSVEENTIYVHGEEDFDIILSFTSGPRRDRFTLAHELGHYLLHSRLGEIPLVASRRGSNRAEWEANWFAAGLLMPETLFRQFALLHNNDIALTANRFGVSEAAAKVRMGSLSL